MNPQDTEFEYDGQKYKAVDVSTSSCYGCEFRKVECRLITPYCTRNVRNDKRNVIFVKAEESV